MNSCALGMMTPSILIVDDERQIHSSLRLRLGEHYHLTSHFTPQDALAAISREPFDLCFVDVHMPDMDGIEFIEAARQRDDALGFVILSGYDSEENLRRAIPLQVLDFLAKPLPDRAGFESRVPGWIDRTRSRRHELLVARGSESLVQDLEVARIEREVELTASASAREALLQTASLLTTTNALLFNAQHVLESLARADVRLAAAFRGLQEARKHAESAATVAEGYFGSAYADRESSPAWIDACLKHAIGISQRLAKADERQQRVDCLPPSREIAVAGLTGIEFLLMMVPTIVQSLLVSPAGSTLQIRCHGIPRLDRTVEENHLRSYLWVNRRNAATSGPGVMISIRASSSALDEETAKSWLHGRPTPEMALSSRGLLHGIQKARGLLGVAIRPKAERFELIISLGV
jgi:CheY-like chemotaxis protein